MNIKCKPDLRLTGKGKKIVKIIALKVLSIALLLSMSTQIVQPFFVAAETHDELLTNVANGPQRSTPVGETKYVGTWNDLKALGTMDGDTLIISGNYTVILTEDLMACCPVRISGNVHISAQSVKTIYRQKDNANFTVFTVDSGATLTLADNVIMSGDVAESHTALYTITVTDAYGAELYKTSVFENETRTPSAILEEAGYASRDAALGLIAEKTADDPDSPYSLGYVLQDIPWDMAGKKDTPMKDVGGDLLIVAKWNDPSKNKVLHVVDGYGNEIYSAEVLSGSSKTVEQLMREAVINGSTYNIFDNSNHINTVLSQKLSSVSDGPYALGYTFDSWELGDHSAQPFSSHTGDYYVAAKWNDPIFNYVITLTDRYGRTLKTIDVPSNDHRTPLQILTAEGIADDTDSGKAGVAALLQAQTASDPNSPYSLGYIFKSWDMDGNRNKHMDTQVKGDLLIRAEWEAPGKVLKLKVTDGAGNIVFESNDKSKTIETLMQEKGLNANAANDSTSEKEAIAGKVGASAESPANDSNYSFKGWDFGDAENTDYKTKTLAQIDGDLVVCATWNEPPSIEYKWQVPDPLTENTVIELGVGGYFIGVNSSNLTEWSSNFNSDNEKWIIKNISGNTFDIVNKADPSKKLYVNSSASNGMTVEYDGGYKYSTGAHSNVPSNAYSRFSFAKVDGVDYLTCTGSFQAAQGDMINKTVYMIGNPPPNQAVFFSDYRGMATVIHAGIATKKYANPDTAGRKEVAGPGTPSGTIDQAGITPKSVSATDHDDDDAPGRHSTATGQIPLTTKAKQDAGSTDASITDPAVVPIDKTKISSVRYTRGDADQTQIFDKDDYGFFVHVKNGGTLDIEGAIFTDLKTGRLINEGNNRLNIYANSTVKRSAPIVVDGGMMHFTSGSIINNEVGYLPNESKSGMMAQGSNPEDGSGVENFIKSTEMMNTAGGVIFKNGAIATISGNASIRQNKGDAGGIIVQDPRTDVTLGGYISGAIGTRNSDPYANVELTISNGGHIDQNVGFHHGGGALVEHGGTLRMVGVDSTMNHNVTWSKGGAVWVTDFGTNGYANINYREKRLVNGDIRGEEGIFIMKNGTLDNNTAFLRGGAINVQSNRVHLIGGTISNNNSRVLGGGIYVEGDFANYTYTLMIDKGYVGHNYAVRFWDLDDFDDAENDVNGSYDSYTLRQLNDRLDRKLGQPDTEGNPLVDENWDPDNNTYFAGQPDGYTDKRTADVWAYYRPHEGFGGGVWLCPIGGTAIFHLHNGHEVIIDDNYASGTRSHDPKSGTDIYLHTGTGHILVANSNFDGEDWVNEETREPVNDDGKAYSGPLYLENVTSDSKSRSTYQTYGQEKSAYHVSDYNQTEAENNNANGIRIINNVSRDGGGIGANGTLLFGLPKDVYRHEAELGFKKIWPATADTYPVVFKFFYIDPSGDMQPLEGYEFHLNGVAGDADDYEKSPETTGANSGLQENGEHHWTAKTAIPIALQYKIDGVDTSYPLYKIEYIGENITVNLPVGGSIPSGTTEQVTINKNDIIDPSTEIGMKKIYAVANHYNNRISDKFRIRDWKLVLKEYNSVGMEIRDVEFSEITNGEIQITKDDSVYVIDSGGIGKKVEGYKISFTEATFDAQAKNDGGPEVEKYINNVVHESLISFDDTFEYEIMAYVPKDATEVLIYDTLVEPLEFVRSSNSSLIGFKVSYHESNDHIGDGTGTVNGDGTPFSGYSSRGADAPTDPEDPAWPSTWDFTKNTIYVKIDGDHIKEVAGKWVKIAFNAKIKDAYKDLDILKQHGWISEDESKKGSINFISELEETAHVTVTKLMKNASKGLYYARGIDSNGNAHDYIYVSVSPDTIVNMSGENDSIRTDTDISLMGKWYETYTRGVGRYKTIDGTYGNVDIWDAHYKDGITFDYDAGVGNIGSLLDGRIDSINNHPVSIEDVYNYPVIEAVDPHSGTRNQADYIVTYPHGGKAVHKTNIVTVDVMQPEKYVNSKTHDLLETFDEIFEYEIMTYVPEDADEVIIWDTLRDDLMFVSNTGIKQFTDHSGTLNSGFTAARNSAPNFFMVKNDPNAGIYQLVIFNSNDHIGNGTGTVATADTELFTPFTNGLAGNGSKNPMNMGYVRIGDAPSDASNVTLPEENLSGNTLYIKIDSSSSISVVRGKWVRVKFNAAIRPGSYDDIAEKISESNVFTRDQDEKDPKYPDPVGYYYRTSADGEFINFSKTLPAGIAESDMQAVYVRNGWNGDDPDISWEYITDDGYVVDGKDLYDPEKIPFGVEENTGNHAGLANKANVRFKIGNEYRSIDTNTVTVIPDLEDIEITKHWIVEESYELPSFETFLGYLHLFRDETDITSQYAENREVTINSSVTDGNTKVETWKVKYKGLPKLTSNVRYSIKETPFDTDVLLPPNYRNIRGTLNDRAYKDGAIDNADQNESFIEITANKRLVGKDLKARQFRFGLFDENGQQIGPAAYNDAPDENGIAKIIFEPFVSPGIGRHKYYIRELDTEPGSGETHDPNVIYDPNNNREVLVTIRANNSFMDELFNEMFAANMDAVMPKPLFDEELIDYNHWITIKDAIRKSDGSELGSNDFVEVLIENSDGILTHIWKSRMSAGGSYSTMDDLPLYYLSGEYTMYVRYTESSTGTKKIYKGEFSVPEQTEDYVVDGPVVRLDTQHEYVGTRTIVDYLNNDPTFENIYEAADIKIEKRWDDNDDLNGARPRSIKVSLIKIVDGQETKVGDATLRKDSDWKYVWERLPKKEDGKDITYKIVENKTYLDNYTDSYSDPITPALNTVDSATTSAEWNDIPDYIDLSQSDKQFRLIVKDDDASGTVKPEYVYFIDSSGSMASVSKEIADTDAQHLLMPGIPEGEKVIKAYLGKQQQTYWIKTSAGKYYKKDVDKDTWELTSANAHIDDPSTSNNYRDMVIIENSLWTTTHYESDGVIHVFMKFKNVGTERFTGIDSQNGSRLVSVSETNAKVFRYITKPYSIGGYQYPAGGVYWYDMYNNVYYFQEGTVGLCSSDPVRFDEIRITRTEMSENELIVTNKYNYQLPSSGGIGTLIHTFSGTALIATSFFYFISEMEKKKRK